MKTKILSAIVAIATFCSTMMAADFSGTWHGTLKNSRSQYLNLVISIITYENGTSSVVIDSPDQGIYGVQGNISFPAEDKVVIVSRQLEFSYDARLTDNELNGKCRWGVMTSELNMKRGELKLLRR